ncbi:uncharacterized homolog [Emydura macquarii macquarii]|uniref:uncharacterized homolog n=1 Tax=Emydura macquarii macquarii TaxID=1129001 RepID=UPI00352A01A1
MARGTRWLLIRCALCLALAATGSTLSMTPSQLPTSSQHSTAEKPPQATSGETSLSAAPASSTSASTQEETTAAAPASSRTPESTAAPSPPLAPASPSPTSPPGAPAASSRETHATGLTTGLTTERPGHTSGSAASGSASPPVPGSATALQTTEEAPSEKQPSLSRSPGLVAVICIFVIILTLATVVVMAKLCRRREPAFKKLDEVPMGKMTEDSPFARYPPK